MYGFFRKMPQRFLAIFFSPVIVVILLLEADNWEIFKNYWAEIWNK